MRKYLIVLGLLLGVVVSVRTQTMTPLSNTFIFKDGLYTSYEEFLSNSPSITLEELQIKDLNTVYFNKLKLKYIKKRDKKGKWKKLCMDEIWGICINGIPHIQYQVYRPNKIAMGKPKGSFIYKGDFTRLRILGNICHFNIEDFFASSSSYFYQSDSFKSEDSRFISTQKMMKLSSGVICDYNERNLGILIQDDLALFRHFNANEDREDKLFLYLQKYNERNPYLVSNTLLADRE